MDNRFVKTMTGRRGYRLLVVALAISCVVALLILRYYDLRSRSPRFIGVVVDDEPEGLRVSQVLPDNPAEYAGLLAGDLIIALDGEPIRSVADYRIVAQHFSGDPVAFTVLRGEETWKLEVVPGVAFDWSRFLASAFTALAYLGIALLAFLRRPQDHRVQVLALFSVAVACELVVPSFTFGPVLSAAFFAALFMVLSGIELSLELHLASVIPEPPQWLLRRPWVLPTYYTIGIGYAVVSAAVIFLEVAGQFTLPLGRDELSWFFNTVLLPAWALAVILLLARTALRHPSPPGRHQALLVLLGILPWGVTTFAGIGFRIAGLSLPGWMVPLESFALLCYPLAVLFAIFLYQLFAIELVVRRGLVYTALTALLVVLFYLILGTASVLFSRLSIDSSVWVVSAATLVLGLLCSPLRDMVQRLVDRRFFPERHALRDRLITLAGELPVLGKLPLMGRHLVEQLQSIFAVRSLTIFIGNPEAKHLSILSSTSLDRAEAAQVLLSLNDPAIRVLERTGGPLFTNALAEYSPIFAQRMRALDARLVVPVLSHRSLVGLILSGAKRSGDRFPAEEVELLALLSHHVATTFENARLFETATYEGLTGLLRREAILEHLQQELERALRYRRPLSIGLADIDRFKGVNDSHGHLTGDAVLKQVAQVLSGNLRSTDAVGRYGGEEFLLVLPETGLGEAWHVAEKIRTKIEQLQLRSEDGAEVHITISIGLATLVEVVADRSATAEQLLAVADHNLYTAKRGGRNRVHPPSE